MGRVFFFVYSFGELCKPFEELFKGKGGSGKLSKYGWYVLTKNIAKTGVFNNGNDNSIRSVELTNAYKVLHYAMIEKIEIDERNKEIERANKK